MSDDVIPIRKPEIIATFGGLVDGTRVSLCLYGDELDPDEVSRRLGSAPTHSHRKGDRKGPRSPARGFKEGAWILTLEGKPPIGPDELLTTLLGRFPSEPQFWADLGSDYIVRIIIGVDSNAWNRGFDLQAATVARVANTGARVGFDLYFMGED